LKVTKFIILALLALGGVAQAGVNDIECDSFFGAYAPGNLTALPRVSGEVPAAEWQSLLRRLVELRLAPEALQGYWRNIWSGPYAQDEVMARAGLAIETDSGLRLCLFQRTAACHFTHGFDGEYVGFRGGGVASAPEEDLLHRQSGPTGGAAVLGLSGMGTRGERKFFVESFIHEASHHADKLLILQWLEACDKLEANGYRPDRLYQNFGVRKFGAVHSEVNEEFMRVFTEARAYRTGALIEASLTEPENRQDIFAAYQAKAFVALIERYHIDTKSLNMMHDTDDSRNPDRLDGHNLFQRGLEWGRVMLDTINRARNLR
jgi:hypothetical protein